VRDRRTGARLVNDDSDSPEVAIFSTAWEEVRATLVSITEFIGQPTKLGRDHT